MRDDKMSDRRRFARVRPSGLVPKSGKIIVDPKQPAIDCDVIDLSAGGACLFVHGQTPIPRRFVFLHGATRKRSNVVWARGRKIGVLF